MTKLLDGLSIVKENSTKSAVLFSVNAKDWLIDRAMIWPTQYVHSSMVYQRAPKHR